MVTLNIKLKGITHAAIPAEPPHPPDPKGRSQKVQIQLFQNMVMLHIKLKGMMVANILPSYPPPPPPTPAT